KTRRASDILLTHLIGGKRPFAEGAFLKREYRLSGHWGAAARDLLLLRHLAEGALPVLDMIGARNFAADERMHIERHQLEGLAVGWRSHQFASRRSGGLATDDNAITGDQNLLDFPFQIRNCLQPLG